MAVSFVNTRIKCSVVFYLWTVVLCGCETWSATLREEQKLSLFVIR